MSLMVYFVFVSLSFASGNVHVSPLNTSETGTKRVVLCIAGVCPGAGNLLRSRHTV